jgi:hypothetical protein
VSLLESCGMKTVIVAAAFLALAAPAHSEWTVNPTHAYTADQSGSGTRLVLACIGQQMAVMIVTPKLFPPNVIIDARYSIDGGPARSSTWQSASTVGFHSFDPDLLAGIRQGAQLTISIGRETFTFAIASAPVASVKARCDGQTS